MNTTAIISAEIQVSDIPIFDKIDKASKQKGKRITVEEFEAKYL